jgi:4-carboxymuconolactone decarboxylase
MTEANKGATEMTSVLGDEAAGIVPRLEELAPGLGTIVREFVFGSVYRRPGLDLKVRQLVTVTALATLGHCQPQLELHLRAAARVGWSREELAEVLLHLAVYAGFPTALNALTTLARVFPPVSASNVEVGRGRENERRSDVR